MAGHRQVNSRISKGSQNILIYNLIITTFDCQGNSQGEGIFARAFLWCHGTATDSQTLNQNKIDRQRGQDPKSQTGKASGQSDGCGGSMGGD